MIVWHTHIVIVTERERVRQGTSTRLEGINGRNANAGYTWNERKEYELGARE